MGAEIREVPPDELYGFVAAVEASYGHHATAEDFEDARLLYEPGRCFGAYVDGRIVGGTATLSLELTVPGGTTVRAGGVTDAGVLPTHRRRGLFRELTTRQLQDARERGEVVTALTASEGTIYGRFGYGIATSSTAVEVSRPASAFASPLLPLGELRLLGPEEAALLLPDVFDTYRRAQSGEVTRSEAYWEVLLHDRERWRDGGSARFVVAHEAPDGEVDGYVAYRMRTEWPGNMPDFGLDVDEVVALSPAAHAALWRYVLDVDLVGTVSAWNVPPDEPMRWLLADPRGLRVTGVTDMLWLRLVDVAAALGARRYARGGRFIVEVEDAFWPSNTGRYVVEGGPEGASARAAPTGTGAHLAIRVGDLGAAFLGGVSFSTLARAGRVVEHTAGAVATADAMFSSDPLPHCTTDF
ncbi:MAG: GNAT family N-acetyltransferase [Actinomycetota bacterium]|nr:GNAT family N-acetyltransferase [Actinomycetota bacterium]